MTNDELLAAWRRKLPNVEPTDRDLSAFALGVEVGADALDSAERERDKARETMLQQRIELAALVTDVRAERDAIAALLRECRDEIQWFCNAMDLMPDDVGELMNKISDALDGAKGAT